MDQSEILASTLAHFLERWGVLSVWLIVFLSGENGILASFAVAAQGFIAPIPTFLLAFLGSLSADIFWFLVGRYSHSYRARHLADEEKTSDTLPLLRLLRTHTFLFMTFMKFLVGMRLFLTLYVARKLPISFKRYLVLNTIGTGVFVVALFPVGWWLGKGVSNALDIEHRITSVFTVIVLVLLIGQLLPLLVRFAIHRFSRKNAA